MVDALLIQTLIMIVASVCAVGLVSVSHGVWVLAHVPSPT